MYCSSSSPACRRLLKTRLEPRERCTGRLVRIASASSQRALAVVRYLESKGIEMETPPQEIDIVGAKRFALFRDPDGILLEFACWTKDLGPDEAHHTPATPADRERYLVALEKS